MNRNCLWIIGLAASVSACGSPTAGQITAGFVGSYRMADSLVVTDWVPAAGPALTLSASGSYQWRSATGATISAGTWDVSGGSTASATSPLLEFFDTTAARGGWFGTPNVSAPGIAQPFALQLTDNRRFYGFVRD